MLSMTARRRLTGLPAIGIWLLPIAGVIAMLLLAVFMPRDLDLTLFLSLAVWIASFGLVGALLATRLPHNPVGWLLWASALCSTVAFCGSDYAGYSLEHLGGSLPATVPIAWASSWTFIPAIGLTLVYVPLLFPDGRLPSRRWLPLSLYGAVAISAAALVAFAPTLSNVDDLPNPLAIPGLQPVIDAVGFPPGGPMAAAILLAFLAPIVRFRRGDTTERRQLKWFAFVLVIVFVIFAFGPDLGSFVGLALLPIGIGVAVLRYRLYEIDRIISRTLAWALLTAILASLFVGCILILQAVLASEAGSSGPVVVVSTLLVATLFQPLRRRIQSVTDRRFNRSRYDATKTLAGLAGRLSGEVDLGDVTTDVVRTVVTAMEPASAGIWLHEHGAQ